MNKIIYIKIIINQSRNFIINKSMNFYQKLQNEYIKHNLIKNLALKINDNLEKMSQKFKLKNKNYWLTSLHFHFLSSDPSAIQHPVLVRQLWVCSRGHRHWCRIQTHLHYVGPGLRNPEHVIMMQFPALWSWRSRQISFGYFNDKTRGKFCFFIW